MVRLKSAGGPALSSSFFQIRYVISLRNRYEQSSIRTALVLIWIVALTSAAALHYTGTWFQSRLSLIGLELAFAGALGNLIDILEHKFVIDFVDLRWWPVFNLADVGIVGGLVLAFVF